MTDRIWSRLLPIAFGTARFSSGKLLATPSFDDTTAIREINGGDFEGVAALEVFQLIKKKCWLFLPFLSLVKSSHPRD